MKSLSLREFFEKVVESAWLVLLLLGMISIILGAGGNIRVGSLNLQAVSGSGSYIFWGIGSFLVIAGLAVLGLNLKNSLSLKGSVEEVFECEGTLSDWLLIDDLYESKEIKTRPMPQQRVWEYKLTDILIRRYTKKLELTYTAQLHRPDGTRTETYESTASGPYIDGVAYLQYQYKPKLNTKSSWNGVMVLQIPRHDQIKGIWLTTNIRADRRFPIGVISLRRKD